MWAPVEIASPITLGLLPRSYLPSAPGGNKVNKVWVSPDPAMRFSYFFHDFEPWRMAGGQESKKIMLRQNRVNIDFAMFRKQNDEFQWISIKIPPLFRYMSGNQENF